VLVGGRQANIDTSGGTGQTRIQLWMDGLMLFFRSPIFGIGPGNFGEALGHVAHNSYVHAFTEMGLVGGTLFVGIVYYSHWMFFRLRVAGDLVKDPDLYRMGPYVTAAVTSYSVGMLSLSNCYVVPTYAIFGLATAYINLANPDPPLPDSCSDRRLALR